MRMPPEPHNYLGNTDKTADSSLWKILTTLYLQTPQKKITKVHFQQLPLDFHYNWSSSKWVSFSLSVQHALVSANHPHTTDTMDRVYVKKKC